MSTAGPKLEACDVFDGVSCLPAVTGASGILLKALACPPLCPPNPYTPPSRLPPPQSSPLPPAPFEDSYPRKLKAVFKEQTREEEGSADKAEEKGFVTGVTARWRVKKGLWCLSSTPIYINHCGAPEEHLRVLRRAPVMTLFHTSESKASREAPGKNKIVSGIELKGPVIQISNISMFLGGVRVKSSNPKRFNIRTTVGKQFL